MDKGGAGSSSVAFFTNFLIAIAASPPVEMALPAIRNAVAKHTGHMSLSLIAILLIGIGTVVNRPRLAYVRKEASPASDVSTHLGSGEASAL
jgi:hypothetical protein